MKKLIALILCMLLVVSMSIPAFAAVNAPANNTGDVEVIVTDENGNPVVVSPTYNVVITWGDLVFELQVADPDKDVEWDGTKYTINQGKWDSDAHEFSVTNKSDAAVAVKAAFANGNKTSAPKNGVSATISNGDVTLASAVNLATPASTKYTVSLSTVPATLPELSFTVDTITVTVSEG